jgi:hypothetical protein
MTLRDRVATVATQFHMFTVCSYQRKSDCHLYRMPKADTSTLRMNDLGMNDLAGKAWAKVADLLDVQLSRAAQSKRFRPRLGKQYLMWAAVLANQSCNWRTG